MLQGARRVGCVGPHAICKGGGYALRARRTAVVALAATLGVGGPAAAVRAASAAWNVDADGNWEIGTNWTPAAAPGATSGTTNPDVATFGFALTANRTVAVDPNRNVAGVTFGNTSAFGYTLAGGPLVLSAAGTLQTTGAGSAHTDTVGANIVLGADAAAGTYTFGANATVAGRVLAITGNVSGAATGTNATTLNLNGANAGLNVVSGAIGNGAGGGSVAVSKSAAGTWSLAGANTYTGNTTATGGGVLRLDYSANDNSKLSDTGVLTLGFGTVTLNGGTHAEVVGSTTLSANSLTTLTRAGGSATLALGAVTPAAGGTLIFAGDALATTSTLNTNGVLGGWARVVGGGVSALAANSTNAPGGSVVAYMGYADVPRLGPTAAVPNDPAANVRVVDGGTSGGVTAAGGALTSVNTLQMSAAGGPATIALGGGPNVLTVGTDAQGGFVWQTAGAGALTVGATANDGLIRAGGGTGSGPITLSVVNDSANPLTFNAAVNNGGYTLSLTKTGTGTLVLNGNNAYGAGATTATNGVTTIGSGTATNAVPGGTLVLTGNNAGSPGNVQVGFGSTLQLQANAGNTSGGVSTALGTTGVAGSLLSLFNSSALQLRSDSAVTFGGTNNIGALNNATVGFDVNGVTAAGANNVLTVSPGNSNIGNAVTLNVTGGQGNSLALGTFSNITGTATNLTINPTTVSVTVVGFATTTANPATLTLTGTNTGANAVTGVISNGTGGTVVTAVTKTGTGAWALSGAPTYTGTTTVTQGALSLTGNRTAASGAITVANATTDATLNIGNGTFTMNGNFTVAAGTATPGVGTVNQTGGSITLTGTALLVGNNIATGVYNLSGGTLTGPAATNRGVILGVNTSSKGTFNLSGTGVLAMGASNLQIARTDTSAALGATGVFNQTGGTAAVGTLGIAGSSAGAGATEAGNVGTLNLTGGTFSAAAWSFLAAGNNGVASITVGGTAQVALPAFPTLRGTGATASLTFDGGTLTPTAASTAYLSGLTNAFVTANGAKLNVPAGTDITIAQPLVNAASQVGVLTKLGAGTLTLSGASTYTGATTTSAGALAVAGSLAGAPPAPGAGPPPRPGRRSAGRG
jgi:fibronectin-binding autotransporter adhesin